MKVANLWISFFFCITSTLMLSAQGSSDYGQGLKVNLNTEGSKYVRFLIWNQLWARTVKNNPGTAIGGEPVNRSFDIGARRLRFLAYAQLSPRYLVLTHFGINNQTFINGGGSGTGGTGSYGAGKKPQLFFHDAWNEYAVIPSKNPKTGKANKATLYAGAGLHYWLGISRISSASTLNFLLIDAPIFNWPTLEISDQFIRQFGVYTKGVVGKLHYQMHINKPFSTSNIPVAGGPVVDNNGNPEAALGGYFDYQLLEQESNVLPYRVGSYVGTKKILNIGAGLYHTRKGTRSLSATGQLKKHDIGIGAVDVFADLPIGAKKNNMAVTVYSVLYNYDFGPGYIRTSGVMNTGLADTSFTGLKAQEGAGNARFMLGTGIIWFTQAGLLLPQGLGNKIRVQPVAAYTLKKLDALNGPGHYYDIGSNFFIDGHDSKITLQYSSRPLYFNKEVFKRAGEWLLQFQVYL